jgi:hypothetical protein
LLWTLLFPATSPWGSIINETETTKKRELFNRYGSGIVPHMYQPVDWNQ